MITRVHGPARNAVTNTNAFTVSMTQPANGNVLIACIGLCRIGSGVTVNSISQTGVAWQHIIHYGDPNGTTETEIWSGNVTSGSASTTATIILTGTNPYYTVADICEYSGLLNANYDRYAWNGGAGGTTDTGTTSQTTQNGELWIGATTYSSGTYGQGNPTKNFTLLDGQLYQSVSLGYLEYISHNKAVANSGTVNSGYANWSGCIATFKAAGSTSTYDNITVHDIIQVDSPNGGWITLYGVDYGMGAPILEVSQSLLTKNDILAYGSLTTMSDPSEGYGGGALNIGHGWEATWDNPRINLSDSGYNTLYITAGSNYDQYGSYTGPIMGNLRLNDLTTVGTINIGSFGSGARGPLYVTGSSGAGTIAFYSSSIRFKENVVDLSDCSWLYNLRPITFDWKEEQRKQSEGRQMGLIAEEVNELCPQLVFFNSEGKPEGVHYEWLGVPLLVEVKKLRKRVEVLENQFGKPSSN